MENEQEARDVAELLMLGSWRIRRAILRKSKPTRPEIINVLLILCFVDVCGFLIGRKEVRKMITNVVSRKGKWRLSEKRLLLLGKQGIARIANLIRIYPKKY